MFVFCDDRTCKNNFEGVCRTVQIHITVTDGLREDGTRGPINSCNDYEDGREDAEAR
jgi:hypothetical protein